MGSLRYCASLRPVQSVRDSRRGGLESGASYSIAFRAFPTGCRAFLPFPSDRQLDPSCGAAAHILFVDNDRTAPRSSGRCAGRRTAVPLEARKITAKIFAYRLISAHEVVNWLVLPALIAAIEPRNLCDKS
jgi:hypothetical protein